MKYLTRAEVADLLRVSERTITEYRTKGLLPMPTRLGRRLLWNEDELLQALSPSGVQLQVRAMAVTPRATRGRPRKVTF